MHQLTKNIISSVFVFSFLMQGLLIQHSSQTRFMHQLTKNIISSVFVFSFLMQALLIQHSSQTRFMHQLTKNIQRIVQTVKITSVKNVIKIIHLFSPAFLQFQFFSAISFCNFPIFYNIFSKFSRKKIQGEILIQFVGTVFFSFPTVFTVSYKLFAN